MTNLLAIGLLSAIACGADPGAPVTPHYKPLFPFTGTIPTVTEAHHRASHAGFKYLATELVCWATGGPQHYSRRSMRESHQHLLITATEWEACLDDLQHTLDTFAVPPAEQEELKAMVASTGWVFVV